MKKYVKPELYYENFELSQHIAACGIDVNLGDTVNCTPTLDNDFWPGLGGVVVFDSKKGTCSLDISDIDVYCYTVGTNEAGRTFNS